MMLNSKKFLLLIILSGAALVTADFLILSFFGIPVSRLWIRFGLPALAFLILYIPLLGRNARCFTHGYFLNLKTQEFSNRIKETGAVPIKMIALNVVSHAVFLGALFFHSGYLGIESGLRGALFLVSLAFGMLVGTFIYVAGDGLVSRTLLAHNLTQYPRDLRENRQELKAFIIPTAVALMTIPFASAITMLGMGGNETREISMSAVLIPLIIFFCCIIVLTLNLKKNSSILYNSITAQLENLSSEQKDLTKRIGVGSVDELGTIAGMVNTFCEYLNTGIHDIKAGQRDLADTGNRLEENTSAMAVSIAQISGAVEQVLRKTQSQMNNASASSAAIHRTAGAIKTLETSVVAQVDRMNQASAAVEEMVSNISSIGSLTEKMAAQFKTVGEAAAEGTDIQKNSGERIRIIVEQSQALQAANQIIAVIAAQTNLLAMNAAIEAAHAGEAGRGFSVVADEIRKLAENSSNESQKIGAELKQIVTSINQIVKDSEVSGNAFAEVSRRANETEKLVFEVNNAIREQKSGAGQVMESLRAMNEITVQVSDGSTEISRENTSMINEIDALQNSAKEITVSMEEMSGNIGLINANAREVSDLAGTSKMAIQKISAIADGFEV